MNGQEYVYDKIHMSKPNSKRREQTYLTIIRPCIFVKCLRWESFGRVNLQGRKITTLHSTLPAAQETRWNDLISCPLHVASRLKKQGGITSLPVPSTWTSGRKQCGMTLLPPFSKWPTGRKQGRMTSLEQGGMPHFLSSAKWPAGQKSKLHDITSCPSTWLARQKKRVKWPNFLSTPRG